LFERLNLKVGGKQQMKKLIPTILILIVACDNKPTTDTLTGDLYFSFFRLGNYYNQPDSIVQRFETYFDTLAIGTANSDEKKLLTQYQNLKDKGLLYHPFVYLLSGPDSVVALYLDTLDYEQTKKYKRQRLQDEHKKVRIEASVTKIDSGLFLCNKLKKVELIDGETLQRQRKLKIEDYN
jgi:hypothetical protein